MKTPTSFNTYLNSFVNRHIKNLPRSFESIEHYRDTFMFIFNGWMLLKKFPEYSSSSFKIRELEKLLHKFDQFDTTLGRPLEMQTIRSITFHPTWQEIIKESKILSNF